MENRNEIPKPIMILLLVIALLSVIGGMTRCSVVQGDEIGSMSRKDGNTCVYGTTVLRGDIIAPCGIYKIGDKVQFTNVKDTVYGK